MATTIGYNINANTAPAQSALEKLYAKGAKLFGDGFKVKVDSRGFNSFERSLNQATDRIISFTATTLLISKVGQALSRLTLEAIEVEKAITGIQSILNATTTDLGRFQKGLFDIANKTGTAFFDVATAANEFSRAGLSLEKTLQATAAAMGIVRTSGGKAEEAVQGLISAANSFDSENLGFGEIADKLSAVDAAFSTSAAGLIQGIGRVGVAASDAGVQFNELLGYIASVKQISGRSEAQIGNSLKTIFTRLGSENVQGIIEKAGVSTKDANGQFRTGTQIITDLAEAFKTLTDSEKAYITQKVAGVTQANAFASTIKAIQSGSAERATGIAAGADNNIEKRLKILNETTSSTLQRFQNSITELSSTLGDAVGRNFVDGLLRYGNIALDGIKSIFTRDSALGNALTAGLSAALTGPGIVLGVSLIAALAKKIFVETVNAGKALLASLSTRKAETAEMARQAALQKQITSSVLAGAARPTTAQRRAALPQRASAFETNPAVIQSRYDARGVAVQQARKDAASARAQSRTEAANSALLVRQQAQEKKRSDLRNSAFAASFLVPAAISGIASQTEDPSSRRNLDAVGAGLSTAFIGAAFGGIAAAGGIVIGAFQILGQVTRELYGNLEDTNAKVREGISQNEKTKQSGDIFVQAVQKYNDALDSGKNSLVEKAQADLLLAQRNLDASRKSLIGITNIDKLVQANDALNAGTDVKSSDLTNLSTVREIITKSYSGFFDGLSGVFEKKLASQDDANTLAKQILSTIDVSKIDNATTEELTKNFAKTGDSNDIQQYILGLTSELPNATEAFSEFARNFKQGENVLSTTLLGLIRSLLESTRLSKLNTENLKVVKEANKAFGDTISAAFANRSLSDGARSRQRDTLLQRFEKSIGGLTGAGATDAQTKLGLLGAQNDFASAIDAGKKSFLPELEEALVKTVEGADKRGRLIQSIESILGEGFDPAKIKGILESTLGENTTSSILRDLDKNLKTYSQTVKNSTSIYNESIREIAREAQERARLNKTILGNPREDQSSILEIIRKGNASFRASQKPQRDRNGNIIPVKRTVEDARKDLDTLEAQGKTGIKAGTPAQIRGRVRGDFETIVDAQRTQTDQALVGDLLDEFFKKNKKGDFGFGGEKGAALAKQNILKQIADNNFTSVPGDNSLRASQALDRNPLLNAAKANPKTAGAKDLVQGVQDAQQRSADQVSIAATLADEFINTNDLLKKISDTSERILAASDGTFRVLSKPALEAGQQLIQTGKSFVDLLSPKDVGQQLKDSDRATKIQEELRKVQSERDKIIRETVDEPAKAQQDFTTNLENFRTNKTFLGKLIGGDTSTAQENILKQTNQGAIPGLLTQKTIDATESNDFKGKQLNDQEIERLKDLARSVPPGQLNYAVKTAFGDERGQQIISGGSLDPLRTKRDASPVIEEETTKKLDSLTNRIQKLTEEFIKITTSPEKKEGETDSSTKIKEAATEIKEASANISKGISQTVNGNIDVNLTGLPEAQTSELLTGLETTIKAYFEKFYKEATGKAAVLAPTAPA